MHFPQFDQYLGQGRPSGGTGEYRYACPFCRSGEWSMSVNFVRKRFICFRANCAQSGSLTYLASKLGFEYTDSPMLSSIGQMRHRLWNVDDGPMQVAPKLEEPVKVPEGLRQIEPGCLAWDYLMGRGLTPQDVYYNELSLASEDRGRRIYFLQRDETGRIIYWVGRKYLPGTRGPKYKNPVCSIKKRLLYRSDRVDRNQPIAVVEGPISAIVAGNAVATLGVLFSREQVQEIAGLGTPIYSAMDGEAFSLSVKLARKLEPYGTDTRIVPLPRGVDPADAGRQGFLHYTSRAFRLDPGSVQDTRERLSRLW